MVAFDILSEVAVMADVFATVGKHAFLTTSIEVHVVYHHHRRRGVDDIGIVDRALKKFVVRAYQLEGEELDHGSVHRHRTDHTHLLKPDVG
ncbi:hypothetical protein D9M68_347500 [compost metagenome]